MVFDKEYFKAYYLANKDKIKERQKEYSKQYYLNNKEHIAEHNKQYYLNNNEKIAEHNKVYSQTDNGKKTNRINTWKQIGVISDDFNELYNKYINTNNCDNCDVELIHGNFGFNKKVLDHCHKTGKFRNVLCNGCNIRRG
tara:strand:- start:45 stop:464 length:420 start_codon:yes stop_codon:yes gene_type:complete